MTGTDSPRAQVPCVAAPSASDAPDTIPSPAQALMRQLAAARYYVHQLRVFQYAGAVLHGALSPADAAERYDDAMRNYDGVIDLAPSGHCEDANTAELAKGAAAIGEALEQAARRVG